MKKTISITVVSTLAIAAIALAEPAGPPKHEQEVVGEGLMVHRDELMKQKPNVEWAKGARIWAVEKTPEVGSLLVEVVGTVPMHFHPDGHHRMYMIEGEMKMWIGTKEM